MSLGTEYNAYHQVWRQTHTNVHGIMDIIYKIDYILAQIKLHHFYLELKGLTFWSKSISKPKLQRDIPQIDLYSEMTFYDRK